MLTPQPGPFAMGFLSDDFLLQSKTARLLFHECARELPVIDYHNHLPPAEIAADARYDNLSRIWLQGDHYKWRAMRANGIPEERITGGAGDYEKFLAWAETVPYTLRNPLYHWTHMELKNPFGIANVLLNTETAPAVWEQCNAFLAGPGGSARALLRRFSVKALCTTDDPTDQLEHHAAVASSGFEVQVLPTFRPDRAMMPENTAVFYPWLQTLRERTGEPVTTFASLLTALRSRQEYFARHGCKLADHGVEAVYAEDYSLQEIEAVFAKILARAPISSQELAAYKSACLYECALMNHDAGWVQQLHIGPLRNVNSRMMRQLGPDTGFDTIGDAVTGNALARFLNRLEEQGKLAKTILYNLNPRDNELFAAMAGNFQDGSTPGKIQYGSAWWFLDQKNGVERQIEALSNMGLLSRFVGMLTDSRSFLSFPRHEYFRRILCNILGTEAESGLLPYDLPLLKEITAGICYNNAARYFNFS